MNQEQAAAAVLIALISEKNKSRGMGKKKESVRNPGLKGKKIRILWNSAYRTAVKRRI